MNMSTLTTFVNRMKKIGIELEMIGNYPWIYLDKVNGKKVTEKFQGNHGFTLGFLPVLRGKQFVFTDTKEIFKLIKKYKMRI